MNITVTYYASAMADQGLTGTRTLKGLATSIGSSKQATIVLSHTSSGNTTTYSMSQSVTLTSNITLKIEKGAVLSIADGKTLTINGSFDAGRYQVFNCVGTGKVVSGTINEVYPEWWGAKGDGINDDSSAILNSVEFNTIVLCSTSIYKISVDIVINHNINIIGNNSTLNFINDKYLTLSGSRGTPEPILSDITCGDKNISINNSSLQKGDLFLLQNDLDYSMSLHRYYYKMADFLEVFEVDENNIYTNEYIQDSYPSANSLIFKITTFKFSIKDLNIISTDTSPYTVNIFCGKDCILNNVNTTGGSYGSIILDSCYNTIIDNCKIYNNSIINIGYNYGLSISQSKNVKVTNSRMYSLRHAVAVGNSGYGLSRNILIDNCTLSNNYELGGVYCADFHGSVINGEYRNCSITGGASLAGINTRYINNTIIAPVGNYPAINLTEIVGGVFIIDGNTIIEPLGNINSLGCIKSTSSNFCSTISYDYNLIITNNIFEVSSAQRHILLFGTHDSAPNVKPTVYLNNNYFKGFTSTLLSYVKYHGGSNVAPKSVTISNFHKGDLPNTFILFDHSAGLLSGCKVTTPRDNYLVPLTITSGNYDATTTVSFDYIHCESIKGPDNNFYTPIKCSIRNTLINGDTYLFSSIQYNNSTSASILITTGNTTQLVTATMTYYVDVEVGGSFIHL